MVRKCKANAPLYFSKVTLRLTSETSVKGLFHMMGCENLTPAMRATTSTLERWVRGWTNSEVVVTFRRFSTKEEPPTPEDWALYGCQIVKFENVKGVISYETV